MKKEYILTPQQDRFCRYYTQNEALFSNATLSYAEAFNFKLDTLSHIQPILEKDKLGKPIKWGESPYTRAYNSCASNASRLLRSDKIQKRITECLNELMTEEFVDSQLMKVITQNEDKSSKMAGVREFNKLKQRILDRQDITSGGEPANIIGIEYIVPKKIN